MQSITPEVDSAILDLIESFKTIGAYLAPGQEPPVMAAHRALVVSVAAALRAERERCAQIADERVRKTTGFAARNAEAKYIASLIRTLD
jgi:hypothetical protein